MPRMGGTSQRVAVVGGGIGGLTAAHDMARGGCDVVLFEATDRVGGKLRLGEVGGLTVDLGAESILARRPEALDLSDDIGLTKRENPRTTSASIWTRGQLRTMPPTVMGVPGDLQALVASGIVARTPVARAVEMPQDDVSVASFVAERVGQEVVDRLIEPLLGGVYAGHADQLSLRATAPQVAALGADLLQGARDTLAQRADAPPTPVFFVPTGGVGTLPEALVRVGGFEVRTDTTVRAIDRLDDGAWRLTVGPTTDIEQLDFDAVVVATPAPATSRLLSQVAPRAAFALAEVQYASVALVTFVLDGAEEPEGSGFLVPPIDGTSIKAATYSTAKWQWSRDQAEGLAIVRTSLGRAGEALLLHHDDATLTELARTDLQAATGSVGRVVDARVQRWGGGLPQYAVGHLDLVDTVEADVAEVDGLEVCGAAYRGVGIPAVIGTARAAATRVLARGTMDT